MIFVEIVSFLALIQFLVFGALVGRARGTYGVKAPAVSGNEMFERYYRVHMNTLELLITFLPGLWLAARHWSPALVGAIGAVYLFGRVIYLIAYVKEPSTRGTGFLLSIGPVSILLLMALLGVAMESFK